MGYVLITAARNESQYIESTIRSIIAQTRVPDRWVIVSDDSTDGTDEIVSRYNDQYAFITLLRLERESQRSFSSKSIALNYGISTLNHLQYEFIGCLDADITLESDYYEKVLLLFAQDPLLGVAGGFVFETNGERFVPRPYNAVRSVAGAIQMFRESCFKHLDAFLPLRYGGEDTIAEVRARMLGFHVESFYHLRAYHNRHTGASDKPLRSAFKNGLQDFYIGYHPLYELFTSLHRIRCTPPVISFLLRLAGFIWGYLHPIDYLVPNDQVLFLRKEQIAQMRYFFYRIFGSGSARYRKTKEEK